MSDESEAVEPRRRRGRPSIYGGDGAWERCLRTYFMSPDGQSKRSMNDAHWKWKTLDAMVQAGAEIDGGGRFEWIVGRKPNPKMKASILSALGRLGDAESILAAADRVCREQMSTRQALAWLRRVRGLDRLPCDIDALADVLVEAINRYATRHEVTQDDVDAAVKMIRVK